MRVMPYNSRHRESVIALDALFHASMSQPLNFTELRENSLNFYLTAEG